MKNTSYSVIVNGSPLNCYSVMSLKDILIYLNFNIDTVIVEYNQEIVNCSQFDQIYVNQNDCIEVITIVGGG